MSVCQVNSWRFHVPRGVPNGMFSRGDAHRRGATKGGIPPQTEKPPTETNKMPTEYKPSGSPRSSRRGGRSRSRRGGQGSRNEAPKPAKKKNIIEKIIGFFGGKDASKQKKPSSTAGGGRPEGGRQRGPRGDRPTGMRKPEQVEVTSPRLYVGNLSFDVGESDLFDLFNGVGSVQNVEIVMNRHTMRSKGFAFVQMQSIDEAKRAVAELHDKEYVGGRKLVVSGAKAVEERRSERPRQPEQTEQ